MEKLIKKVVELYNDGWSIEDIAEELGLDESSVAEVVLDI